MKAKDVKNKSPHDLAALLKDLREELRVCYFSMAGVMKKGVRRPRVIRHDIARIETILSEGKNNHD